MLNAMDTLKAILKETLGLSYTRFNSALGRHLQHDDKPLQMFTGTGRAMSLFHNKLCLIGVFTLSTQSLKTKHNFRIQRPNTRLCQAMVVALQRESVFGNQNNC